MKKRAKKNINNKSLILLIGILGVLFVLALFINNSFNKKNTKKIIEEPDEKSCFSDADCVPASCCHPFSCVSRENAPSCNNILCTTECVPGTMDCGQGYCGCENGKCKAFFGS